MTNLSLLIFTPNISELFNIIISISKPLEQAHHKQKERVQHTQTENTPSKINFPPYASFSQNQKNQ